jgi:hypothetical protein
MVSALLVASVCQVRLESTAHDSLRRVKNELDIDVALGKTTGDIHYTGSRVALGREYSLKRTETLIHAGPGSGHALGRNLATQNIIESGRYHFKLALCHQHHQITRVLLKDGVGGGRWCDWPLPKSMKVQNQEKD